MRQIGITPDLTIDPAIDEAPHKAELALKLVTRLARAKALAVSALHADALVLAGDTVVACGRRILPKCADRKEVEVCLNLLSGRRHKVFSAVCVAKNGQTWVRVAQSAVAFKRLSASEIAAYLETGEGVGKAGGYALQGQAARFIRFVSGSPSGIVGLPLFETMQLLRSAGYEPRS